MWKKFLAVGVLISVFGGVCTAFAYEVPQNIKVGLYFGNASEGFVFRQVSAAISVLGMCTTTHFIRR